MIKPALATALATCTLGVLLIAAPAAAAPTVRVDPALDVRCPDGAAAGARWAEVYPGDDADIDVQIEPRTGFDPGLTGTIRVVRAGQAPLFRRIEGQGTDCASLVEALLTAGALMASPIALPPPPPAPEPEPAPAPEPAPPESARPEPAPPAPEPEPALPESAPSAPIDPLQPDAEPAPDRDATRDGVDAALRASPRLPGDGLWYSAAGRFDVGAAPAALIGAEALLAGHFGRWSVGAGVHASSTAGVGAVGEGDVGMQRLAAVARGCVDSAPFSLGGPTGCVAMRAGAVFIAPEDFRSAGQTAFDAAIGLRAGWRVAFDATWAVRIEAEGALPLRRVRLLSEETSAWTAELLTFGAGLALEWHP